MSPAILALPLVVALVVGLYNQLPPPKPKPIETQVFYFNGKPERNVTRNVKFNSNRPG